MNPQTVKQVEIIRPHFTESSARASVEKGKKPAFLHRRIQWCSSIPLYIPFWLVEVEMDLKAPRRGSVQRTYTIMVNAITNRGLLVSGQLETERVRTQAIFVEREVPSDAARETARIEALVNTKRMINPPPHRVLPGERLVWYPLALVEVLVNGKQEVQVFDYYRGGLDKFTMRFLKLKDKMAGKAAAQTGVIPSPSHRKDV